VRFYGVYADIHLIGNLLVFFSIEKAPFEYVPCLEWQCFYRFQYFCHPFFPFGEVVVVHLAQVVQHILLVALRHMLPSEIVQAAVSYAHMQEGDYQLVVGHFVPVVFPYFLEGIAHDVFRVFCIVDDVEREKIEPVVVFLEQPF